MADNYVSIRIKADDSAKPDLSELRARLEELAATVATARAEVDDAAADAKLADLEAKLAAVGKRVESPRIDMAGAQRALAQVVAVQAAMDDLEQEPARQAEAAAAREQAAAEKAAAAAERAAEKEAAAAEKAAAREQAAADRAAAAKARDEDRAARAAEVAADREARAAEAAAAREIAAAELAARKQQEAAEKAAAKTREAWAMRGANLGKGGGLFALGSLALSASAPLAAAGAAVGAFGAVAIPVLSKVGAAQQALTAARGQYNKVADNERIQLAAATSAKQRASIEATASKQRAMALDAEKQATAGLTSQQKGLMGQVGQLSGMWGKLESAMTPVVVNVAKVALSVAGDLMPAFQSLASVGGNALETILGYLGQFVRTPFFTSFIRQMGQLADQVAPLLGQSLVGVLQLFGQLFEQAGPAGVQILGILLPLIVRLATDLVPVIAAVAKVVAAILEWLQSTHLLLPVLALVALAILAMEAPIAAIIIAVAVLIAIGVELARHWHQIWTDIKNWVMDAWDWIKGHWPLLLAILTGPIGLAVLFIATHWRQVTRVFAEVLHWVESHWPLIMAWIVDPIGQASKLVRTHTHQIAQAFDTMRHDVAAGLDIMRHAVAQAFDAIRHAIASALDVARHAVASAFDAIRHAAASELDALVRYVEGLPGRVVRALAALPGLMFSAGRNVIMSLISGIESQVSALARVMGGIAGEIRGWLPFSPARKGPLSGSGAPVNSGRSITRQLAQGLAAGLPDVSAAMSRVAGTVSAGRPALAGGYGGHGGGGGGEQVLRIVLEGSDSKIINALAGQIRQMGGSPEIFQRKVVFQ